MPQKIIIVRHGETNYNIERRLQGWMDIPLNKEGLKQADKVAERLKEVLVTSIYTSDLKRANSTAKKISKKLGIKPSMRHELREDNLGVLEGWKWEVEVDVVKERLWKERDDTVISGDLHWREHGGDSRHTHTQRVKKFLDEIEEKHPNGSIIIVSHGGTINRIMEIYGLKDPKSEYINYGNTSVTILEKSGSGYKIELDNDTSHL